jgi:hypothetical protein
MSLPAGIINRNPFSSKEPGAVQANARRPMKMRWPRMKSSVIYKEEQALRVTARARLKLESR